MRHREVELGAPFGPLDRAVQLAREQAARDELRVRGDLVAEAAADVLGDEPELVDPAPDRGRHHDRGEARELVVAVDRPLPGAAVVLDERAVALERRRVEAVEVELRDPHDTVGLADRVLPAPPLVHALPDEVRAGVGVQDIHSLVEGASGVDDHTERLVLDLDELGCVTRQLARLRDDDRDRVAGEAHAAHRQRVVLDLRPRRRRELEERIGERRHLVARQRPDHARELERPRHVDRADHGMRVRRADVVREAHVVALEVVDEDALALQQPPVLLAREALALPRLRLGRRLDLDALGGDGGLAHSPTSCPEAALTASTMFQ